jgi:hypothetical protein
MSKGRFDMSLFSLRRCLVPTVLAVVLAPLVISCSGGKTADPGGNPPADSDRIGPGSIGTADTQAIKPQPANPETIRRDKAIADYTEAIRKNPNDADSRGVLTIVQRGGVYAQKGEQDKAIADFTEGIRLYRIIKTPFLSARLMEAYEARARSYQKLADYDKAIADYTEVIHFGLVSSRDPGDVMVRGGWAAQALYVRGVCYDEKEEPILAVADFKQAVEIGFSNDDLQRRMKKARASYTETEQPGKLGPKEREKAYPTKMTAGKTYHIELTPKLFGMHVRLEDDKGKIVAENDAGNTEGLHVVFTPPADGSYRIVASKREAIGANYSFRLIVREVAPRRNHRDAKPTTRSAP